MVYERQLHERQRSTERKKKFHLFIENRDTDLKLRLHDDDDDDDDDEDEEDEMTIFVFYLYKVCVVHRRALPFLPEKEQRREGGFLSRILLGFSFSSSNRRFRSGLFFWKTLDGKFHHAFVEERIGALGNFTALII